LRRFTRYRPSPGTVIACIALAIALGGTSYAAVVVPRNSVGTAQLRNNAVTSLKVANRSLRAVDFALGQVPRGPQGPSGPAGAVGPTGPAGPAGPSDAFHKSVTGAVPIPSGSSPTVAALNITQPGKYAIAAKLYVETTTATVDVTCTLQAAADQDESKAYVTAAHSQTLAHNLAHDFPSAGAVELECSRTPTGGTVNARHIRITAIKVSTLSLS
jgi:hypothetical protein